MFTGIIDHIGRIAALEDGNRRCLLQTAWPPSDLAIGASLACSGVCLTITARAPGADGGSLVTLDISGETLQRSTAGSWQAGTRLNLERALRLGEELGGHFVLGHVDATAEILDVRPDGDNRHFRFAAPAALRRFLAPKGSVTLDGVSLTVNAVGTADFTVNLVPHTLMRTGFGAAQPGDRVNIEVDALARYVARLIDR